MTAAIAIGTVARRALLHVARVTIEELARGGRLPAGAPHVEAVRQPGGAIVRLGDVEAASPSVEAPLWRAVQAAAARAIEGRGVRAIDETLVVTAVMPEAPVRRGKPPAGPIVVVTARRVIVVPAGRSAFEARAKVACGRAGLDEGAWEGAPAWGCKLVVMRG